MSDFNLPEGWLLAKFGDLNSFKSSIINPDRFGSETFELFSVPIFPTKKPEIVSGAEIGSSKQLVDPKDILLCKINPRINRVWRVSNKGQLRQIASSEWIVFRQQLLNENFVLRYFQSSSFRDLLCSDVTGVGGSLTRAQPKNVVNYLLPLAPLAEQQQIAQKLDELLAQVDTLKIRLDAIPNILKRFRQSVLAAAVSGRLTEGVPFDVKTLGDIIEIGPQNGIYKPSSFYGEGNRIVRIDGFYDGEICDWEKIKRVKLDQDELLKWQLNVSDILINRVNSIEYLGKCALVRTLPEPAVFESNIMLIKLDLSQANPEYVAYFLSSVIGLERLRANAKLAVNQASINQTDVKNCQIQLPPIDVQEEIVRKVKQLFTYADQIEQRVKDAQARVNHLTQSILAKAFRGELTADWRAQNPELISGENSAAALLERIRVEREKVGKTKRKVKA